MTTMTRRYPTNGDGKMTLTIKESTGTRSTTLDVEPSTTAGEVAQRSGADLHPGHDAIYELRDDRSSDYFPDDVAIGDVLPPDPELVVQGKSHLG